MNSARIRLVIIATAFAALANARADKLFFGEVPVQYVATGDEVVLDMHRFLHPPNASVTVESGDAPLYLVGETFKDRAGIDSFVGPNMLDGQFDFPLYDSIKDALGTATAGLISLDDAITASKRAYGKATLMSPLIGNHDKGRFMAYADGELPDTAFKKEEEVGWQKPPTCP